MRFSKRLGPSGFQELKWRSPRKQLPSPTISVDVVQALRLAHINGATTICVTNYGTSPITEVSDICLFTQSEETQHSILAMSSRIAQLTIFDAIYSYIVSTKYSGALEAILNTETALKEKRY